MRILKQPTDTMRPQPTCLLLIDDDPVEGVFVEDANDVVSAFDTFQHISDAVLAIGQISKTPPSAVLLDLRMPGLSGFDVLKRLAEAGALEGLVIAVLSNSSNAVDKAAALENGAVAYYVKPPSSDGYAEILRDLKARFANAASQR